MDVGSEGARGDQGRTEVKEVCSSLNVETEVQIKELSPLGTDTLAREVPLRSVKAVELKLESG